VVPEGGEHMLRAPADTTVLARHGLQPRRFALVVGTRAAHKGLGSLAEMAALLTGRGMRLAVAGAADPAVFRNAGDPHGADVAALGRVTDAELRALYEAALCLVFPSRYEGFGLPPLEAMACGCPVLAAASGAVPEVCGDAALWFDSADGGGARSPAEALERLLREQDLAEELRRRGLERAARFSWRAAAERLLALLPAPAAAVAAP
jgi:glycosyltransferase involved in cell wall biosynthesis